MNAWHSYLYGLYGALEPWGSFTLTVTSPPQSFREPITLAEANTFLRRTSSGSYSDTEEREVLGMISAARAAIEYEQARQLVRKQWDLRLDYWPAYAIELMGPLVSVDLVQYTDSNGTTLTMHEGTDYVVDTGKDPGVITAPYNSTWPSFTAAPSGAILIRFTAGYDASDAWWQAEGAPLKQAMKTLVSKFWNERLPGEGGMPAMLDRGMKFGARMRVR